MDVSPYLMRRLRSLDEFLEAKGSSATLWRQEVDQACGIRAEPRRAAAASGAKGERTRLVLVCSNDQSVPVDGGGV